jgi:hypothetical protein
MASRSEGAASEFRHPSLTVSAKGCSSQLGVNQRGTEKLIVANESNVRDSLGVSATISVADNPVFTILNGLLGAVWRACAQHQTHIAVIEAWGLQGLADAMRIRTTDEPVTIRALLNRLADLDATPAFTIEVPAIGVTVLEILDNDMALQRHTRSKLNAAAKPPELRMMPPREISSSRFSQTKSGI